MTANDGIRLNGVHKEGLRDRRIEQSLCEVIQAQIIDKQIKTQAEHQSAECQ